MRGGGYSSHTFVYVMLKKAEKHVLCWLGVIWYLGLCNVIDEVSHSPRYKRVQLCARYEDKLFLFNTFY